MALKYNRDVAHNTARNITKTFKLFDGINYKIHL